ncbi:MAG: amidophosphoribosyltransferase [Candidatus Omnitrophica bacterium]|nr:amidophosphoribosyltransferase [Candidatus Omnitrophota bacterium]MDD5352909.1 amidophosphoribosyltransferase [Candidatus Omnitrophota bacterium]MDD5550508.1 amidophosphoribosyltransferase [Candidatus Omnitrophota bacterium]
MQKKIYEDGERLKEFCGLFGIYGNPEASSIAYLGLYALQHRGEESCGIVSSDGQEVYMHRAMGQVCDVFDEERLRSLKGHLAIGHVRYSTTGSSSVKNAQPLFVDHLGGYFAIGHNGNLINSFSLKKELEAKGSIFQTSCDSEIIIHLMARSKSKDMLEKLVSALKRIKGAYSLVIMTEDKLIGVRDPLGFRPLCLGKLKDNWCLASETCAFDLIEAKLVREIEPGEIVIIDKKGIKSIKFDAQKDLRAHCIFEHVYFSRPDSIVFGETVHLVRQKLGETLAKEHPVKADFIIPIPDSGTSAALGFSHASKIPLELGVIRNHYVGRTFIQPHQHIRDLGVRVKFNILKEVVRGKRVVIVDDSIVRGTTSRIRVKNFRLAGAKEVHMRVACPPHKFPCFYGIDFPRPEELIANKYNIKEIAKFLDVDSIGYLSLKGMLNSVKLAKKNYCTACWNGDYPLPVDKNTGKNILEERCIL